MIFKMARRKLSEGRRYIRNKKFLIRIARAGGLPSDFSDESGDISRRFLESYPYSVLYGSRGEPIPLKECDSGRLRMALKRVYEEAKKQTERFERENPNSGLYGNLVLLIEAEDGRQGEALVEAEERTAIVLDNTPDFVRREFSKEYGGEVLGDYFVI